MILVLMGLDETDKYEGNLVDFINMGEEGESIIECIHKRALQELLSRSLASAWDWQIRTMHMFEQNKLHIVQDLTTLSVGMVNRLVGCGYRTRKEVYEVLCSYHIRLKHWEPRDMNYKF